jgi:hypothetical protein
MYVLINRMAPDFPYNNEGVREVESRFAHATVTVFRSQMRSSRENFNADSRQSRTLAATQEGRRGTVARTMDYATESNARVIGQPFARGCGEMWPREHFYRLFKI